MREDVGYEVRIPSIAYDKVRKLQAERRFSGEVRLRKVVTDGPWDLIAIVACEREADADLVKMAADVPP